MKERLDRLLVAQGLAPTRQKAQALIVAGLVLVDGHPVDKAGTAVDETAALELKGKACPYVSRGGLKLEAGLDFFAINPAGLVCADIGASTGGFTDCLLQRGARQVYAIDVGYGQLDWRLRNDPKVVVRERMNARNLTTADFAEPLDFATIDAAFISLKLLLPPLLPLFKESPRILALIKPQFEVGKEKVGKGGVVRDPALHEAVIAEIIAFAETVGLMSRGVTPSPILGPKGNREFLVYLTGKMNGTGTITAPGD